MVRDVRRQEEEAAVVGGYRACGDECFHVVDEELFENSARSSLMFLYFSPPIPFQKARTFPDKLMKVHF